MKIYKKDSIIKVQVTGIEKYGIFVSIDEYYKGLIHISEISDNYVKNVSDYVSVGETIYTKILDVDEDNLQLKLSIKNVDYKVKYKYPKIIQTSSGFNPLKNELNIWINEKIK